MRKLKNILNCRLIDAYDVLFISMDIDMYVSVKVFWKSLQTIQKSCSVKHIYSEAIKLFFSVKSV